MRTILNNKKMSLRFSELNFELSIEIKLKPQAHYFVELFPCMRYQTYRLIL